MQTKQTEIGLCEQVRVNWQTAAFRLMPTSPISVSLTVLILGLGSLPCFLKGATISGMQASDVRS